MRVNEKRGFLFCSPSIKILAGLLILVQTGVLFFVVGQEVGVRKFVYLNFILSLLSLFGASLFISYLFKSFSSRSVGLYIPENMMRMWLLLIFVLISLLTSVASIILLFKLASGLDKGVFKENTMFGLLVSLYSFSFFLPLSDLWRFPKNMAARFEGEEGSSRKIKYIANLCQLKKLALVAFFSICVLSLIYSSLCLFDSDPEMTVYEMLTAIMSSSFVLTMFANSVCTLNINIYVLRLAEKV